MKFIISGKNITVTDGLRTAVEDKLGKLERYFTPDTEVVVTLSVEKERQKIEVTIPVKGNIIRSEQVSNDMYVSIDLVEEVIERQLRKYKNKIVDKQQAAASFQKAYLDKDYEEDEEEGTITIYGDPKSYAAIQKHLEECGFEDVGGEFTYIPNDMKDVTPEQRETIDKMIERLEEFDDVQTVYTNMKPEEGGE
jgi:ribosomal subunit interface protein